MKVTTFRTPRGIHLWSVQGHGEFAREKAIQQALIIGDKKISILLRAAQVTQEVI